MERETQTQIANSLAEENYYYQIKALGFMAVESLRGVTEQPNNNDGMEGTWRRNVSNIAVGIQVFCFGINCQVEADQSTDALLLNSAIFQINALSDFAVKALSSTGVEMRGGLEGQRKYVNNCGVSIQDFCESIAAQICSAPSRGSIQ